MTASISVYSRGLWGQEDVWRCSLVEAWEQFKSLITLLAWTLEVLWSNTRDFSTWGRGPSCPRGSRMVWSLCNEVYYQTDKHLTALMTAVLTVKCMTIHCGALSSLTFSVSFSQGPICLIPQIQSNKYANKQRERGMVRQFANCLSTLSSIKMWDKFKACLILARGGRAQTQTICLRVITQRAEGGKGERYNCRRGRHTLLIMGVERHRKAPKIA